MTGNKPTASIIVVGSINMDVTIRVNTLAARGETVSGNDAELHLGGKGANQAIAGHRLGAKVRFIARIGDDAFGVAAKHSLQEFGLDLSTVLTSPGVATGVAMIAVDQNGQNSITLSPGANARLSVVDVEKALSKASARDILLLQNEVSADVSAFAAAKIKSTGGLVILDPAPAQNFDDSLIALADIVTPNESEAMALTGIHIDSVNDAERAARSLVDLGAGTALIKMGAAGVLYVGKNGEGHVPARNVSPVDTVAAGDCFNGALAVALGEKISFHKAVEFACSAAAISVTRKGAAVSMPTRKEVRAFE
jgi:ribokinase